MLCFAGHVVLVVFSRHLLRMEQAIRPKFALSDYAFAFTEQIGQDSRITDGYCFGGVRHNEIDGQTVALALHTTGLHHSAYAKSTLLRRVARRYSRRGGKKQHVTLESAQHECCRNTQN